MLAKTRSQPLSSPAASEITTARQQKTKGISLVKGPVGLIGLALLAYGITALIFGGHAFAQHAPNGAVHGKTWLGVEVNGWSGLLFIAAGLLLLLAAPLHWSAKGMSLIVGLALGAVALIALGKAHGALGIFAANHLTELVWGAAAALLIVVSLLPRVGGRTKRRPVATRRVERERTTTNGAQTDSNGPQTDSNRAHGARTLAAAASGTTRESDDNNTTTTITSH